MIDSGRKINPAKSKTELLAIFANGVRSPRYTILSSERQITIFSEYTKERLLWLEDAIAAGRCETWLYYQVAELAAKLGQTEKAQRYLRIVMTQRWHEENSTLTHYGDLRNG